MVTTTEFEAVDPYAAMEAAWECEPQGDMRVYYSRDLDLWFVQMFKTPTAAATVSGSGHVIEQAWSTFMDSCRTFLEKRDATISGVASEAPSKVQFNSIGCGPLWLENRQVRRELEFALAEYARK